MKKLILITLLGLLFSCSKKADVQQSTPTWLNGKWKGTLHYRYYVLHGVEHKDTTINNNEFIFNSTSVSSSDPNETCYYIVTASDKATIENFSGGLWYITAISNTKFSCTGQIISGGPDQTIYNYTDIYVKE